MNEILLTLVNQILELYLIHSYRTYYILLTINVIYSISFVKHEFKKLGGGVVAWLTRRTGNISIASRMDSNSFSGVSLFP